MNITISQIEEQFDIWNKKAFNNELPVPHFYILKTRSTLGRFSWRKVFGEETYMIGISNYYDRPMDAYINTIVHEMAHFWIRFKGIKDRSSHGPQWKALAADLNRKFGLDIQRTNPAGGGVSQHIIEKKMEKKIKTEVCVLALVNGKWSACVIPELKIQHYYNRFSNWKLVEQFKIVRAPWSITFDLRHCNRGGCAVRYISNEAYKLLNECREIKIQ